MEAGATASSGSANAATIGNTNTANTTITSHAPRSVTWPRPHADPDRREGSNAGPKTGVVQPKPQVSSKRAGPSSIIVSPRQKGNKVLKLIELVPWEYGDIPADFVLGLTTCALFLSLKYHRLHPEYIYTRIKALQGKYNLRIVLVWKDIDNSDECLRELSKTSLINNVTLIMCSSAEECARYLVLFKQYENASKASIQQHQSTAYADRMVDFITTPRSINKTDAVSLVSQFGTLRTALNARPEEVARIPGWGEKKVQRWCASVREPFRVQRAAKRGISREVTRDSMSISRAGSESRDQSASPALAVRSLGQSPLQQNVGAEDADKRPSSRLAQSLSVNDDDFADDEAAMAEVLNHPVVVSTKASATASDVRKKRGREDEDLGEGVMAALQALRKAN